MAEIQSQLTDFEALNVLPCDSVHTLAGRLVHDAGLVPVIRPHPLGDLGCSGVFLYLNLGSEKLNLAIADLSLVDLVVCLL